MKRTSHRDALGLNADSRWSIRKQCLSGRAIRPAVLLIFLLGWGLPLATQAQTPQLLFWSSYSDATTVQPVQDADCWDPAGIPPAGAGCWQFVNGTDNSTPAPYNGTWPPDIWGSGSNGKFQLIADTPTRVNSSTVPSIGDYMFNQIGTPGRTGPADEALYQQITQSGCCGQLPQGGGATQDPFIIFPAAEPDPPNGDLYISYWLAFQGDLQQVMTDPKLGTEPQTWRAFFVWKTAGDYRLAGYVNTWRDGCGSNPTGQLFWQLLGDNSANGGLPYHQYWHVDNCTVGVPAGQWMKVEIFWHRSRNVLDNSGRAWMAVNGQVVADVSNVTPPTSPPNQYGVCGDSPCNTSMTGVNNAQINRIGMFSLYSGSPYPIYQWIDDVQIWNTFPPSCTTEAWCNPPYAPH